MSVLVLTENFPPKIGGSGRLLWEIYRRTHLDRVIVVAGEHSRQSEFDRSHDMAVVRMPLAFESWGLTTVSSARTYLRSVRRLGALARREQVTSIHCGRCLPEGLIALCLRVWKGLPYCCYVHGEEMKYSGESRELTWLMRRVLDRAELLICNSRNTARIIATEWHVPLPRIRLLHPGVDTAEYLPAALDDETRRTLGWDRRTVVLSVGRLQRRKGHDRMIEALRQVRRCVPDVLYAIAGDGDERERLGRMVTDHGLDSHVQFLDEVSERRLLQCYQQCDLFVLPNRQEGQDIEGFGIVLLEAQACGKPVVTGNSGGTPETVHAPDTGLIVDCDNPEALAQAVSQLLLDAPLRARMGEAARTWVVEQFDWSRVSHNADAILTGALG